MIIYYLCITCFQWIYYIFSSYNAWCTIFAFTPRALLLSLLRCRFVTSIWFSWRARKESECFCVWIILAKKSSDITHRVSMWNSRLYTHKKNEKRRGKTFHFHQHHHPPMFLHYCHFLFIIPWSRTKKCIQIHWVYIFSIKSRLLTAEGSRPRGFSLKDILWLIFSINLELTQFFSVQIFLLYF